MALFLVLTPDERKELIETLHITFDCEKYKLLPVFTQSILRGYSIENFVKEQNEIKRLMISELNPAHYISVLSDNDIKNVLHKISEVVVK